MGGWTSNASTLWTWLSAGSFQAGFEIYVDQLSVFMMLIVSGVGSSPPCTSSSSRRRA